MKLRRLLAVVLWIACLPASVVNACRVPMDPYTVVLPAGYAQFDGWLEVPAVDGPADPNPTRLGYIAVNQNVNTSWVLYWDITNGGSEPNNERLLEQYNIPPLLPNFQIRPGIRVNLYDFSAAAPLFAGFFGPSGMKIKEIYDRDSTTGGWGANQMRLTAPWEIPAGSPVINSACDCPAICTLQYASAASNVIAANPTSNPAGFAAGLVVGNSATNGGVRWVIESVDGWTGVENGRWRVDSAEGGINFNSKDTGLTPNPSNFDLSFPGVPARDFAFPTPSEPFFYMVRGRAQFNFRIENFGGNMQYAWKERRYLYQCVPRPAPQTGCDWQWVAQTGSDDLETKTVRFLDQVFSKGGDPRKNGPATAVYVRDTSPPVHLHSATIADLDGRTGKSLAEGGASGVRFVVVDNNPYNAWAGAKPRVFQNLNANNPPGIGGEIALPGTFNEAGVRAEILYSQQVEGHGVSLIGTEFPVRADFFLNLHPEACMVPFHETRFTWFSAANPTEERLGAFAANAGAAGAAPAAPWGNGQNPAFSRIRYTADPSRVTEPYGIHYTQASETVETATPWTNRDGVNVKYPPFNARRLKVHFGAVDATGHGTPLGPNTDHAGFVPNGDFMENDTHVELRTPPLPFGNNGYYPAVTAAIGACGTGTCGGPDGAGNFPLGKYCFAGTIQDTVRPNVVLLVKDTKYNRTYVVNDQRQGWWGFDDQADPASRPPAPYIALPIDAATYPPPTVEQITLFPPYPAPFSSSLTPSNVPVGRVLASNPSETNEIIEFNQEDGVNQFSSQVAAPPRWHPYRRPTAAVPADARRALWVDEDTRLVFKALAWDNIQPRNATPMVWQIVDQPSGRTVPFTGRSSGPATGDNLPPDADGCFEYTFRDANRVSATVSTGECSVMVSATDVAGNRRSVRLQLLVASNSLRIMTLEERRAPTQ